MAEEMLEADNKFHNKRVEWNGFNSKNGVLPIAEIKSIIRLFRIAIEQDVKI